MSKRDYIAMQRFLVVIAALTVLLPAAVAQRRGGGGTPVSATIPQNESEKRILSVIGNMEQTRTTYLSVPQVDGKLLRILTESVNAKNVVEIGTSTGFSGLWFCLALSKTGGKMTTLELDEGRAAMARRHFEQAGCGGIITIVQGDAHENVKKLTGPIDVVFIDADKEGYVDYLEKVLPLVRPGGLILAHNVGGYGSGGGYEQKVTSSPALDTVFFSLGSGLGITLKKR